MLESERSSFEESSTESSSQQSWESTEVASVWCKSLQDGRLDIGGPLSGELTRTDFFHIIETDCVHAVEKMLDGSFKIVHQAFDVCLYHDVATGVRLETITTEVSIVLLESLNSAGR